MSREDRLNDNDTPSSREILVSIIKNHRVVLNRSLMPVIMTAKEYAWNEIRLHYSEVANKEVTIPHLKKVLNNMKTYIKRKISTHSQNKPIKLNEWEKEFLEMLNSEENPNSTEITIAAEKSTSEINLSDSCSEKSIKNEPTVYDLSDIEIREQTKRKLDDLDQETEETSGLSYPELKRFVLLEQLKLTRIKMEKDRLAIKLMKRCLTALENENFEEHANL